MMYAMAMVAEREIPARQCTMTLQFDTLALSVGGGGDIQGTNRDEYTQPHTTQQHTTPPRTGLGFSSESLGTINAPLKTIFHFLEECRGSFERMCCIVTIVVCAARDHLPVVTILWTIIVLNFMAFTARDFSINSLL